MVELDRDRIVQQTRGLADLLQAINGVRNDQTKRTVEERAAAIAGLTSPPLSEATARRLAELDEFRWATLTNEAQRVLQDVLRDRIPEERVQEVRQDVPLRVSPLFAEADRAVIAELVQRFVRANLVLNSEATARAQQDAREAVAPIEQTFERGQTVVRDGQVITPLEIEALEALGLRNPELDLRTVGANLLLSFTLDRRAGGVHLALRPAAAVPRSTHHLAGRHDPGGDRSPPR